MLNVPMVPSMTFSGFFHTHIVTTMLKMVTIIAPTSDKTAPGRHPVKNGRLAGRRG